MSIAVVILVELLGIAVVDRAQGEEAQGRQSFLAARLIEQVAGDLLDEEPVDTACRR